MRMEVKGHNMFCLPIYGAEVHWTIYTSKIRCGVTVFFFFFCQNFYLLNIFFYGSFIK